MNKKKILTAILAAIVVASCVACKSNDVVEDNINNEVEANDRADLTVDESHFTMLEREYPISFKDKDGETVYVNGNLRKASVVAYNRVNSKISKKINAVLSSAYERHQTSGDELMNYVVEAFKDSSFDKDSVSFPWYINTDYEIDRNDGLIISIKEKVEYFGGSDVVDSSFCYNFDVKTGELIRHIMYTEGDDEQRDAADSLIYEKLKAKYGDVVSYDYVISSFVEASSDVWSFTDSGIKIVFNEGEVAPFEEGKMEIEILKSELPESAMQYFLS